MGNAKYAISILDGGSGLGIGAVPAWSWVQSLIKELRSRKPHSQKKKKQPHKSLHTRIRNLRERKIRPKCPDLN